MLDYAKSKTKLHASISPSRYNWVSTGAGKSGLSYNYVVWEHETAVELYIDRGKGLDRENKAIFDTLAARKAEIEKVFGEDLEWQRLDTKRACRIRKTISKGGWKDQEKWPEANQATVDAMIRFEKALKTHVQKLTIDNV